MVPQIRPGPYPVVARFGHERNRISKKTKRYKHKHSKGRADFLDLRWAPLAAPPAPPLARSARRGGLAPIQEIHAELRKYMFMALCFFF